MIQSPPKKTHAFGFLVKWVITPILLMVLVFHSLVFALLLAWQNMPVNHSMFMLAHQLKGGTVAQSWVDYDAISPYLKQASIASEDANFIHHNGFDLKGIRQALQRNQRTGSTVGGSTISQQTAKNLFLTAHRSYWRKGEEAIITLMIEQLWDKQRILTVYLNVAEFGNGIYGVQQASWHYFGKSAQALSPQESALLISLLPNPKYYQKHLDDRKLQAKKRKIIKRMNTAKIP